MSQILRLFWLLVPLLCACTDLDADDAVEDVALRGIRQVQVIVPAINADVDSTSTISNRLKTLLELRLRSSGFTVVPTNTKDPAVMLVVSTHKLQNGEVQYCAQLEVVEPVVISRNHATAAATVWQRAQYGSVGITKIEALSGDIPSLFDELINSLMAANQIQNGPTTAPGFIPDAPATAPSRQ